MTHSSITVDIFFVNLDNAPQNESEWIIYMSAYYYYYYYYYYY